MSIRTNPMKAVPKLLKRLVSVDKQVVLTKLKSELNKIEGLFSTVKKNEDELLDTLTVVDGYLRKFNVPKLKKEEDHICRKIRDSAKKLMPVGASDEGSSNKESPLSSSRKTIQDEKLEKREEVHGTLYPETFKVHYNELDRLHKRFFLSLLLFPRNAVIKKSTLHFWWASVVGYIMIGQFEIVFDYLYSRKLIAPHGNGKCPVVRKFKINPCLYDESVWPSVKIDEEQLCGVYSKLMDSSHHPNASHGSLILDHQKVKLSDEFGLKSTHWRGVFNVGARYLSFGRQWMAQMQQLEVLQLGRWLHDSPTHHIEVDNEEFLKELRDQKSLKYLSLRGISRIFELPSSIFQLEKLAILDLKACHNLERLPNDIASLKNLRHLDLSQCCLLDRMPKGIEKLTNLEVLKGFLIGSYSKSPYRISDLENLKNIERLSIHIESGAVIKGESESLGKLTKLEHLKISWGVSGTRYTDAIQINLPSNLTKLHLEGFPGKSFPRWLEPWNLPALKELKITGGKLENLDHSNSSCKLEILRLKHLKCLNIDPQKLQALFPSLMYAEIKHVQNLKFREWIQNEER